MKSFSEIFQTSTFIEGHGQTYTLEPSWMQGRAIYGGLSTAICLHGVQQQIPNLPPLRSASVNFIGPASMEVFVKCLILRQGKSVTFVQADLMGEKGLVSTIIFTFGAPRASQLDHVYFESPELAGPESAKAFFPTDKAPPGAPVGKPSFTQHFDTRIVRGSTPFSGADTPSFDLWVKHKDPQATDIVALVGLADMPPPAVLPLFKSFAPVSSMSWMFNIISEDLSNESGWWLLGSYAEHASQGYSSQNMTIHNDRGDLVMVGRQNVAVFY